MPSDENEDDIYKVSKKEKVPEKKEDSITNEYYPEETDDEDEDGDYQAELTPEDDDNDQKMDFDSVTETDIIDSVKSNGYDSSLYPKSNSIKVTDKKDLASLGNRTLTNGSTQNSSVYDEIAPAKPSSMEQNGHTGQTYDILDDYRNVNLV
ncbi:unnamed protein product [[Candida] boidinii]|nr:unnamed protein product [[Candida] boidinii]